VPKPSSRHRHVLEAIVEVLDGKQWDADTCDDIACVLRGAGYTIRDAVTVRVGRFTTRVPVQGDRLVDAENRAAARDQLKRRARGQAPVARVSGESRARISKGKR